MLDVPDKCGPYVFALAQSSSEARQWWLQRPARSRYVNARRLYSNVSSELSHNVAYPINLKRSNERRFQGMGIIHTAKKFIVDELYEKLLERSRFLSGRDATELERAKVMKSIVNVKDF